MFTRTRNNVRKLVLGLSAACAIGLGSMAYAGDNNGGAPVISQPVIVGNQRGPVMPTIKLPDGWANPSTGGNGGYVAPPVDVSPSSGTVRGSEVNTSSGTANGGNSTGGNSKPAGKKTK